MSVKRTTIDEDELIAALALALTDASYPRLLKMAPDPPLALTLWGQLVPSDGLSLAIVGSRRATGSKWRHGSRASSPGRVSRS